MKCRNCGEVIDESTKYCDKCGSKNVKGDVPWALTVILIAAAAAIAILFAILFINNSDEKDKGIEIGGGGGSPYNGIYTENVREPTPAPTAVRTSVPTSAPTLMPTPAPATADAPAPGAWSTSHDTSYVNIEEPYYNIYESEAFGFECLYPMHFVNYSPEIQSLVAVKAPDSTAFERITARRMEMDTISSEMDYFMSVNGGVVISRSSGEDWFEMTMKKGNMNCYKYCIFANGYIYSMEFDYDVQYADIYEKYIDDISNDFEIY